MWQIERDTMMLFANLLCVVFNLLDRAVNFAWLLIGILCSLCATREIIVSVTLQQHMEYTLSSIKTKNSLRDILVIIFPFICLFVAASFL